MLYTEFLLLPSAAPFHTSNTQPKIQ